MVDALPKIKVFELICKHKPIEWAWDDQLNKKLLKCGRCDTVWPETALEPRVVIGIVE